MIDLATVDAASAMVVATTCAGAAGAYIGFIIGCVRQSARDAKIMDSLRDRLREKPKYIKVYVEQEQGFNGDLVGNNQWMKEAIDESTSSDGT